MANKPLIDHPIIIKALASLTLPWDPQIFLLDSDLIETFKIEDKRVYITLHVAGLDPKIVEPFRAKIEHIIQNCEEIKQARVFINAGNEDHSKRLVFPPRQFSDSSNKDQSTSSIPNKAAVDKDLQIKKTLEQIGCCIAIASGKGGVGKSATSVNLAVALANLGLRVGLMDADIHGPSVPHMLGLEGEVEVVNHKLKPMNAWGITAMSIGMLVKEGQAIIWRGPMVMGAVKQLLSDVDWGPLDVLLIDTPPGTGDVQLTLTQTIHLDGVIIISTPQDIALLDTKKGIVMFQKAQTPILGIIENMAYFVCPHCNEKTHIFGEGGAKKEASNLGLAFLGEIPLIPKIREASDAGLPIVLQSEESVACESYYDIAKSLLPVIKRFNQQKINHSS